MSNGLRVRVCVCDCGCALLTLLARSHMGNLIHIEESTHKKIRPGSTSCPVFQSLTLPNEDASAQERLDFLKSLEEISGRRRDRIFGV